MELEPIRTSNGQMLMKRRREDALTDLRRSKAEVHVIAAAGKDVYVNQIHTPHQASDPGHVRVGLARAITQARG